MTSALCSAFKIQDRFSCMHASLLCDGLRFMSECIACWYLHSQLNPLQEQWTTCVADWCSNRLSYLGSARSLLLTSISQPQRLRSISVNVVIGVNVVNVMTEAENHIKYNNAVVNIKTLNMSAGEILLSDMTTMTTSSVCR